MVAMQVNQRVVTGRIARHPQVVKADVTLVGAPGHKAAAGQGGAVRPTEYLRPVAPYRNRAAVVRHPVLVRLSVGSHQPGIGPVVQSVANGLINVNRGAVLPHQVAVAMVGVGGRGWPNVLACNFCNWLTSGRSPVSNPCASAHSRYFCAVRRSTPSSSRICRLLLPARICCSIAIMSTMVLFLLDIKPPISRDLVGSLI